MANRPKPLTPADYDRIDAAVNLRGAEVYAVTAHKFRGTFRYSIHVFQRMPNEYEMQAYENTSTSVTFRNKDAKVKSSLALAAHTLYNTLIARAYDVPFSNRIVGEMKDDGTGRLVGDGITAKQAQDWVDIMTKRAAMQELVGQVWSASSIEEEEEVADEGPKPEPKPEREAREAEPPPPRAALKAVGPSEG